MEHDNEHIERVRETTRRDDPLALVCRLFHNVSLLSGYWPVLGHSVVMFLSKATR